MVPFEELPSSLWAVAVPWIIALTMLWFDFFGGYKTSPVLMFLTPLIILFIFMPKESFESIRIALGLHFPDIMDKLLNIAGIFVGAGVGYVFYFFLSQSATIIPLYFSNELTAYFATTKDMSSLLIFYSVVAVGEECLRVLWSKISANSLSGRFNLDRTSSIIYGTMIAGVAWASLHFFAYGLTTGIGSYIVAFALGEVFAMLCVGFAMIRGSTYYLLPAVAAHLIFNLAIALSLI